MTKQDRAGNQVCELCAGGCFFHADLRGDAGAGQLLKGTAQAETESEGTHLAPNRHPHEPDKTGHYMQTL